MATMLFNQDRPERTSLFARDLGPLVTYTNSMIKGAVIPQVLTIPTRLALFGVKRQLFIDTRKEADGQLPAQFPPSILSTRAGERMAANREQVRSSERQQS